MSEIRDISNINPDTLDMPVHPCMPQLSGQGKQRWDEAWAVLEGGRVLALCTLWLTHAPSFREHKTGVVGDFFAEVGEAGETLLVHALSRLRALGCSYAIGPMNGDTWHSYRLVTDRGSHPPFFMEYYTPEAWPALFTKAGFEVIASYTSAKADNVDFEDPLADKLKAKMADMGVVARPFAIDSAATDLRAVHKLSRQSFSKNFLYTDITAADFLALYEKIVPYVDPDFFLLAEHQGSVVGFIFAIPDYLQQQRGEVMDTLIIKTIGRAPDRIYAGLGKFLGGEIYQRARAKGFKSVIHALMHEDNVTSAYSGMSARTIRSYALYGKALNP